ESLSVRDLEAYDGILACGAARREEHLARGWADRVWTWHEAADTTVFHPMPWVRPTSDLVSIGNGDGGERGADLRELFLGPAEAPGGRPAACGRRHPKEAPAALGGAGTPPGGGRPTPGGPGASARPRVAVHVPRRPNGGKPPGTPALCVFEALACGIPLICS